MAKLLQIGQPFQKENPLDQGIGLLHVLDGFLVGLVVEFVKPLVPEQSGMKEKLVDAGQFTGQHLVELGDDTLVSLHANLLSRAKCPHKMADKCLS